MFCFFSLHQRGVPDHQRYGSAAHDQIMRDIDAKLRLQRPAPPPMQPPSPSAQAAAAAAAASQANYDVQTAMRVRRWIESKSVSDVRDCR